MPGRLYVVATPIGNLQDLSPRALAALREADLIACEDTRHSGQLLRHFGIARPLLSLHEHNESARVPRLLERLRQGEQLALISDAGTPLVSDPGFELVRACREAGVPVTPVPGPSALIAALSVAGLPTDRFRFEGFLPRNAKQRVEQLRKLRDETATLVFYESSHRIRESLRDMARVLGGERPASLARELTKLHETLLDGGLDALAEQVAADENQRRGEFVLVVAGNPDAEQASAELDMDALLGELLAELPLKKAVALATRISGQPRNQLYQRALELKQAAEG